VKKNYSLMKNVVSSQSKVNMSTELWETSVLHPPSQA